MYITVLGFRRPRSFVRACICICIVIATYLVLSSPSALLKYEQPDPLEHASIKRDLLFHATNQRREPNVSYDCTSISTQISSISSFRNVEFFFFGKPIMQVFKEVCEERRWQWKMLLDGSSTARLERLIHADALTIVYGTSHALEHGFIRNQTTSRSMLVASVGKAFMATGPKNRQLQTFRTFVESYGCNLNDLKLMPKTFLFSERKECLDFFIHVSKNTQSTWMVKPYGGYGGDKIEMYHQISPLIDKFGKCDNPRAQFLAQEYLSNPLLLNGRKFDVRAYILIARTNPYFLFYHAGYLRVAVNKFSSNAELSAHLTNTHVQSRISGFDLGDHFWSFSELQQYIQNVTTSQNNFVQEKLEPMIKQVGLFLLHSGMKTYKRLPGTYLLLGLDFMITSNYRIWFIEANNYPLWPSNTPKLDKQTYAMANELLDLEMEIHASPNMFINLQPGAKYGSWELVYNELSAHCSGKQYNPCKDFSVQ